MTGKKRRPSAPPDPQAALRDLETRSANAWRSPFGRQLALAASHLPTTKPETEDDDRALADLIKRLQGMLAGRPRGKRRPVALQAAVHLVREGQRIWCEDNGRKRAPAWKTDELVAEAIERVRVQFGPTAISAKDAGEVRRIARKE